MGIQIGRVVRFVTTGLFVVAGLASRAPGQAVFIGLNDKEIDSSLAQGISADGTTVVGNAAFGDNVAFSWTSSGGFINLGDLPSGTTASIGYAVSANGSVVIGEGRSNIGTEGFLWNSGDGILGLGVISSEGQFNSIANGISDDGTIVVGNLDPVQAFVWTVSGGMTPLGYLPGGTSVSGAWGISPDGECVVGQSRSTVAAIFFNHFSGVEAFRWTSGGGMVGLSDMVSPVFPWRGVAASTDGSVIVGVGRNTTTSDDEAFRWTSAGTIGLGDLPGGLSVSWAYDVSGDGSIVVGDSNDGGPVAFIWDAGNGMRNLKDVLENQYGLDLTGWDLRRATGISADGNTIVGFGFNPQGVAEGWVAALNGLPLPCSADINDSGSVNVTDLLALLASWGLCPPPELSPCPGDINGDGSTNVTDLLELLGSWGSCQ